jgi:hypothetical protein
MVHVALWKLAGKLTGDGVHLTPRLPYRNARLQFGGHGQESCRPAKLKMIQRNRRKIVAILVCEPKVRGHHADDRSTFAIDQNLPAQDVFRAAESADPKSMADQDDARRMIHLVFRFGEEPTPQRLHAQRFQQPRRHVLALHAFGRHAVFFRAEIDCAVGETADRFKRTRLLLPCEQVRNRCAVELIGMIRRDTGDRHQPVCIAIGQRSQKDGVHQREDRGVQADA